MFFTAPSGGCTCLHMDKEQYERDLKERQRRHLESVRQGYGKPWQPCMHDQCTQCHGTGVKLDGSSCIHYSSCPCPKCSPYYCGTGSLPNYILPDGLTTSLPPQTKTVTFDSVSLGQTVSLQAHPSSGSTYRNPAPRSSCNIANCPVCDC